jgi:hypothetical protein
MAFLICTCDHVQAELAHFSVAMQRHAGFAALCPGLTLQCALVLTTDSIAVTLNSFCTTE